MPLAIGKFFGPILIGRLFDTVGRKRKMIAGTYIASGVFLAIASVLFRGRQAHGGDANHRVVGHLFRGIFGGKFGLFHGERGLPAGDSRARNRDLLCLRNVCGRGSSGRRFMAIWSVPVRALLLFWGYIAGAILIICGGLSEVWIGVDAEQKSLESIAAPLASRDAHAR